MQCGSSILELEWVHNRGVKIYTISVPIVALVSAMVHGQMNIYSRILEFLEYMLDIITDLPV